MARATAPPSIARPTLQSVTIALDIVDALVAGRSCTSASSPTAAFVRVVLETCD